MKAKSLLKSIQNICLLLLFVSLPACGGGGTDGTGTLSVGLTDASNDDFSAVYITVDEIRVHAKGDASDNDGGWITIATPQRTYNLLDLSNGVVEGLGEGSLAAGSYTQIRLLIGDTPDGSPNIQCQPHPFANYVIDADDGEIHELKVPSGEQSGLKIVCAGKCDIAENQTTELILDFDAAASVVVAGNSGNYNLKPTIKVLTTEDFSIVQGTVQDEADGSVIVDATVTAQIFNPAVLDPAQVVTVRTSTSSDIDGNYELFLKPGDYNLVATQTGFGPAAFNFTALAAQVTTQDFLLTASESGEISGSVSIIGATVPTFAHLSFQRGDTLPGEIIEVDQVDVLSGTGYSTLLAVGDYTVVSSTCGLPTQVAPFSLAAGSEVLLDIIF